MDYELYDNSSKFTSKAMFISYDFMGSTTFSQLYFCYLGILESSFFLGNGSINHYKVRLVVKGFSQRLEVDYTKTFSPNVKPTTTRRVLTIVFSHDWPIKQLDIKNAFLNGFIAEGVYMAQPQGFIDIKINLCMSST